jgi:transcription-repair coupling factor (superfamily II helicase)
MNNYFKNLNLRIQDEMKSESKTFTINNFTSEQFGLYSYFTKLNDGCHFLLMPDSDKAEHYYEMHNGIDYKDNREMILLHGLDHSLYSGHVASDRTLQERFGALGKIIENKNKSNPLVIVTTIEAMAWHTPSYDTLNGESLNIEISDIISPYDLKAKLVNLGYQNTITTEEPGTFSSRGEIFDIFPVHSKNAFRINYFDDMIEEIFPVNTKNNQSLRNSPQENIFVPLTPSYFFKQEFAKNFRENITNFGPRERAKYENRKKILDKINDSILFENYPVYLPLLFSKKSNIFEFQKDIPFTFTFFGFDNSLEEWRACREQLQLDYDLISTDQDSDSVLPDPTYFYNDNIVKDLKLNSHLLINDLNITQDLNQLDEEFDLKVKNLNQLFKHFYTPSLPKKTFLKNLFEGIKGIFENNGEIVFLYAHKSAHDQFVNFLDVFEVSSSIKSRVSFLDFSLENSFYYESDQVLFLSEGDIFSNNLNRATVHKKVDFDLFAEQLATMKVGDYVIHTEHGVGKYLGLETIDISGNPSDYLVLEYANKDKVYVPVYKMDLIQKHADSSAGLKTDNLRTNKFNNVKKKARESAKKLAFDLLKLQAQRASSDAFCFSPPDDLYKDFELEFPYQETSDQFSAIENVINDMQSNKPMDHLVCGDVGFGKTEVAMRAAFKAVIDNKQVAVLVPTTILALQHNNTFQKRFSKFPIKIEFISRLKTTKECNEIFKRVEEGDVDILIGTHKLLSDKIKYKDLGLVIVDEEQRFGVNHKEKLKLLKASIDFLTLTATPLPRTLQLGFLGLKDISIIKTPPPRRQSIKTYLIKEDNYTIKSALDKELNRGGQVFIVHNKVQDMELFSAKIRELVPNAKITVAHGQMPEKELEKKIDSFYKGESQILIATTIIESGIDIPNANTIIIDRADKFGLSQLHQLRGRIGRSDKKAYAYFMIPNDRSLNPIAEKRLKALQTYSEMGAGFNIASSDLEIRGAGDILGAHQSGNIESVGLELYMNLLKDAIHELKGEQKVYNQNVEVKTSFASYIPSQYIENSPERLKQYKRLSNLKDVEDLKSVKAEYSDVYGPLPTEMESLFSTLEIRIILSSCGVKSLTVIGQAINIQFDSKTLNKNQELAGNIANYFLSRPKKYKFSPDYKVLYTSNVPITMEYLIEFSTLINGEILSKEDG